MPFNYDNIPEEMRWDKQWCLAGPDSKGQLKAPYGFNHTSIFNISPVDSEHWRDFEDCVEAAEKFGTGIGFILSAKDCFTCIDLDVKNHINESDESKWTSQEDLQRFGRIVYKFNSYTERSSSGQGVHIWVRGKIGEGCKRDGVEVYSQERFIVCTGDVISGSEIEDRQELLDILVAEIRSKEAPKVELVELEDAEPDDVIWERATTAANSDKFIQLCNGIWEEEYPSQSEADLALLSMFTFYSKSNSQCRRMFRQTALGQRAKATKNDRYLNDTLRLIRSREAAEEQANALAEQQAKEVLEQIERLENLNIVHDIPFPEELQEDIDDKSALVPQADEVPGLPWPPGFTGAVAQYIYAGAPRPVKEVAIISALGLMAGICGKAFTIPQSGLNQYIVLVARSAVGKEAMHSGISNLLGYVADSIPAAMSFVDFTDYASGPALTKAVAANQSFVNVSGEWGRKLARLGMEDGRDGPMQQLRTVMTNLYQKSGPKSIVGGIGYSDKEKNIASVSGVAYSMIGETTPQKYYDSLTEGMMEDGFLSRFTVIEYTGERPPANKTPLQPPHPALLDYLCGLITHAISLNERFVTQEVAHSPESEALLSAFDLECDKNINNSEDEGYRQMWNRAHLKAYRIAALLAVGDDHTNPIIRREHAEWGLEVVRRDIAVMSRRINSGDVGVGDAPREKKILSIIQKYLAKGAPESYGASDVMRKAAVVPRKLLQISTQRATQFTSHKAGQNAALDATIKSLIDSGYLVEVQKDKAAKEFNFVGKCYRVINLPMNTEETKEHNRQRKAS